MIPAPTIFTLVTKWAHPVPCSLSFLGKVLAGAKPAAAWQQRLVTPFPKAALIWAARFDQYKVTHGAISESFGEQYLPFEDPDGLKINLIVSKTSDDRKPPETAEVTAANATKGFHNIVLTLKDSKATAAILTEVFGYTLLAT